jgi:hypothetical protein
MHDLSSFTQNIPTLKLIALYAFSLIRIQLRVYISVQKSPKSHAIPWILFVIFVTCFH